MNSNEAQIIEYKKTIDNILESTNHDKTDEIIRNKIATSISRAISMSKATGVGEVRQPRQTILYRFSTILKDCKTYEQLDKRCKEAFVGRSDCKANRLLEKFSLDWNINFDVPETFKEKKVREERERLALIEDEKDRQREEAAVPAQHSADNVLAEEETTAEGQRAISQIKEKTTLEARLEKLEKRVDMKVEELKELLRYHQHTEDNKVVIIKEI